LDYFYFVGAINLLIKNPEAGMPCPDEDCGEFIDLYASFGKGGYTIRYRIKQQYIVIVRVWHSREDHIKKISNPQHPRPTPCSVFILILSAEPNIRNVAWKIE